MFQKSKTTFIEIELELEKNFFSGIGKQFFKRIFWLKFNNSIFELIINLNQNINAYIKLI